MVCSGKVGRSERIGRQVLKKFPPSTPNFVFVFSLESVLNMKRCYMKKRSKVTGRISLLLFMDS